MVNIRLVDEDEKYDITKGERYAFFYAYAYLQGQLTDNICDTNAGNNTDYLKLTIQLPGGLEESYNLWEDVYNIRELQ